MMEVADIRFSPFLTFTGVAPCGVVEVQQEQHRLEPRLWMHHRTCVVGVRVG